MTIQEIASDYHLPVAAVEEAIAYCRSNPPEIEEDQRVSEALMEASGMNESGYRFNPRPNSLTPQQIAAIEHQNRP